MSHRRAVIQYSALLALIARASLAAPPPGAAEDALSLVREEQTITGATKRPQPISETPSSVSVITAAEIRANGYHTVGEALRWVRGLFVTYDRNYYYLGVRGLQRPGDYNNKVLLALDGHTLNGNVYGDAYFGEDLGVDMESVERIEVVRGPGSALYGSYAALAVVNVVTRRPRSEPGVTMNGRAGGPGERRGHASIASAQPGRPEWRASAAWLSAEGADLYFPEFDSPLTGSGRAENLDGERAWSVLATGEWHDLHLTVKLNERQKTVPTGSFGARFGDPRNETVDGHDFVELSGTRRTGAGLEVFGRAWWDGARYRGTYIYGGAPPVVNQDRGDGDVAGTEWRTNWSPDPRTTLTLGAESQFFMRSWMRNYDEDPAFTYYDRRTVHRLAAVYLQDELRVSPALRVTGGARLDGHQGYAPVVSPRVDLVWRAGPRTSWKVLAGSAFRAPSPYEIDYFGAGQVRSETLRPERVMTVEGALEQELGPVTGSVSAYSSRVRDLIDLASVDSVGNVQFRNRARVSARGLEGELRWVGASGDRVRLATAWQRSVDVDGGAELTNSPRWNAHLVATHAPVGHAHSVGFGVRYLSPRLTLQGRRTTAALVTDGRVGRRFGRGIELGLEARNLFDARYGDPGSGEHPEDVLLQDGRMLFVTLSVRPSQTP